MHNNNLKANEAIGTEEIKNYLKALVKFAKKREMLEELNSEIKTCINSGINKNIHIYRGIFSLGISANEKIRDNEREFYFIYKNVRFFQLKNADEIREDEEKEINFKYGHLMGWHMNLLFLSNELKKCGCEDIGAFGNLDDLMNDGNMIVATNEDCDEHIQIFYEVSIEANEEETILETIIKIHRIDNF